MAFLFKSKKSQDRGLTSRDGTSGSQGSIHSANGGRIARDDKTHRGTPTGSVNSIDNDASPNSPGQPDQQGHGRRGGSNGEITYSGDLPVSAPKYLRCRAHSPLCLGFLRRRMPTSRDPANGLHFPSYGKHLQTPMPLSILGRNGD